MTGKTEYQFRIDFYKAKMVRYKRRYLGRLPSRSTFRRWVRECNRRLRQQKEADPCLDPSDQAGPPALNGPPN